MDFEGALENLRQYVRLLYSKSLCCLFMIVFLQSHCNAAERRDFRQIQGSTCLIPIYRESLLTRCLKSLPRGYPDKSGQVAGCLFFGASKEK